MNIKWLVGLLLLQVYIKMKNFHRTEKGKHLSFGVHFRVPSTLKRNRKITSLLFKALANKKFE